MKYPLGSKVGYPEPMSSKPWYPTICVKSKETAGFKVGEKVKAEVSGVVRSIRQETGSRDFAYEIELHTLDTESRTAQKSKMEEAGY